MYIYICMYIYAHPHTHTHIYIRRGTAPAALLAGSVLTESLEGAASSVAWAVGGWACGARAHWPERPSSGWKALAHRCKQPSSSPSGDDMTSLLYVSSVRSRLGTCPPKSLRSSESNPFLAVQLKTVCFALCVPLPSVATPSLARTCLRSVFAFDAPRRWPVQAPPQAPPGDAPGGSLLPSSKR